MAPAVRVNCVAPSLSESKIAAPMMKQADVISKLHPMKKLGEGKDIAAAAAYLMSEDASWVTGSILNVDGGRAGVA